MKPAQELLENLHNELARFNPEAPLTMLFDYVKIRFPALDIKHVIKDILKLNVNYMIHEDYGRYSYTEHYCLGDVFVYTSDNEEKGVQLVTTSGAPTLKMLKKIDYDNGTSYLKTIEEQAKLTEKHEKIIQQQTASVSDLIES